MIVTAGVTWKDRAEALRDAMGPKRYMLAPLIGFVAGLADALAARYGGLSVSGILGSAAIGLLAATIAAGWWLLERLAQLERRMKGARVDLSILRSEGVRIRNEGQNIKIAGWGAWRDAAEAWNTRTVECIGKIDRGCAEWFSVLDVVPTPRVTGLMVNTDHHKLLGEHDFRVARLGNLIQAMWER